jgi:hypothetical protein
MTWRAPLLVLLTVGGLALLATAAWSDAGERGTPGARQSEAYMEEILGSQVGRRHRRRRLAIHRDAAAPPDQCSCRRT